jgi:hypothetical protein
MYISIYVYTCIYIYIYRYIYMYIYIHVYMYVHLYTYLQAGKKNRSTGATLMNQTSSRSHSIFTIVIECMDLAGKGDHIRVGKLNLVDLAGIYIYMYLYVYI